MQSSPLRNFEPNLIILISNSFKLLGIFCFSRTEGLARSIRWLYKDLKKRGDDYESWVSRHFCVQLSRIMSHHVSSIVRVFTGWCLLSLLRGKKISPILFTGESRCSHIVSRHKLYWFEQFAWLIHSASVFVQKQKHKIWDILTKNRCLLATVILSDSNPHLSAEKDDVYFSVGKTFFFSFMTNILSDIWPQLCVSRL